MEKILRDRKVCELLESVDVTLAAEVRAGGCEFCAGRLHRADFRRKPRGGAKEVMDRWDKRASFCCEREGCRKRHTPPSVRFLGRKVYVGVVVVLVAAMMHGADARRVAQLHDVLGIDKRTLKRWRQWWLDTFVQTPFWKVRRGRFMPVLDDLLMPLCLIEAFRAKQRDGVVQLLKFLSPITTDSSRRVSAM